jgi:ISXO2 transposase-like protein/transposase-like zinc ribbon protein
MKSYTYDQFKLDYPNDDVALDRLFVARYGNPLTCPACGVIDAKFYRIKKRKCYECGWCGYALYPAAGTIFQDSQTPLTKWYFAIFLFSNSKNGVAAMELQRQLGVTYKCALRISRQIKKLMAQDTTKLTGIVEADETYVGGKRKQDEARSSKAPVLGLVAREGDARATVAPTASRTTAKNFIESNVSFSAQIYTDESNIYTHVSKTRVHQSINHSKQEYARGAVTTNRIEGFWSQLKRSLDGTHHSVSVKHLQGYVDYFAWHYNHRRVIAFHVLAAKAAQPIR